MRCSEVMKASVITVREHDNIQAVARLMRDNNIGFVPVVDDERRAMGTITDRDIVLRLVADDVSASSCQVADLMTREIVACRPQDDISLAQELAKRYKKSRILVLDDDDILRGVISLSDLADRLPPAESGEALRGVTSRESRPS
jgi:CBS domain-containing protein